MNKINKQLIFIQKIDFRFDLFYYTNFLKINILKD